MQHPEQDEQAIELIDIARRAFTKNKPLFILVQYNHEADKFSFIKQIQALAQQQSFNTRNYDPLNNSEHSTSKLYPLLETDAEQHILSLVVSLAKEPETDQLAPDFLSYINLHRDRIAKSSLRLVLFVRESEMERFMLGASDLWSFRHRTFWLERELEQRTDIVWKNVETLREALKLSAEKKQEIDEHVRNTRLLVEQTTDKEDKAQLLLDLTQWLYRHNASTLAVEPAIEGIDLLDNNVCDLLGDLEHALGYALSDNSHNADALTHYKASLNIHQQTNNKKEEGAVLNNISLIYKDKGDYDTALNYLLRSLAIREAIGDKTGEGTTLNNISQIYLARGDDNSALNYLKRSLAIRKNIGDKIGKGITLNNIATIYHNKGDYNTALKYLQCSLIIRETIDDKTGEGTTLNNIATNYHKKGDGDTALHYLQRSLAIHETIGDIVGEAVTCWNLGREYEFRGDLKQAIEYISRTLAIEIQTNHPDEQKTAQHLTKLKQQLAEQ